MNHNHNHTQSHLPTLTDVVFTHREKEELLRHSQGCSLRHPPGDEIYR